MLCFTTFFIMKSNSILIPQLHTANIELLKNRKNVFIIWVQYGRMATAALRTIYLSQVYNIVVKLGVSAPWHGQEVFDGLNAINKVFFKWMETVKIPVSKVYDVGIHYKLILDWIESTLPRILFPAQYITNLKILPGEIFQKYHRLIM